MSRFNAHHYPSLIAQKIGPVSVAPTARIDEKMPDKR